MSKSTDDKVVKLELKVLSAPLVAQPGAETPIEVALTNVGESPLVVNSRLGIGYPDSTERDLYCEIQTADQKAYLGYQAFAVDVHRKPLNATSFQPLSPGESLRKMFDLQTWYRLTQPGVYMVRLIYDPEFYPAQPDAVRGPISASPISLTVRA